MKSPLSHRRSGFTLVEILIVLGLVGLILAGMLGFFLTTFRGAFITQQKLAINKDIRTLTSHMTDAARASNNFLLYGSFAANDRANADQRLRHGSSGDLVVFIYYGPPDTANLRFPVARLIGYYRSPENPEDPESTGPVRRFDIPFSPASTAPLESLLPDEADLDSFPEVVEMSRGLANGKLFYNYRERSVVVNGQIFHGNDAKRVTDTYNFTVSPRG